MGITEEIEKRSKEEIEKILSRAEKIKTREIQDAIFKKKDILNKEKEKIEDRIEKLKKGIYSRIQLEYNMKKLKFKEELFNEVYRDISSKLDEICKRENWLKILVSLFEEGVKILELKEVVVSANKEDLELIKNNLDRFNQAKIIFGSSIKIKGGLILKSKDERLIYDNSLETRLKKNVDLIEEKFIEELSKDGNS
jgi:vacuolar-type H+-ATPase subunit E/Vma4